MIVNVLAISGCTSPALGAVLSIMKKIMNLIQIIVPILLMISLAFNLIKLMGDPDNKKLLPRIKNAALATVIVFMVPVFVNVVMGMLGENFSVSACWESISNPSGTPSYINPYGTKKQQIVTPPSEYEQGVAGRPLNEAEGIRSEQYGKMSYSVYVPKDATTNMPLLIWLHGDGGSSGGSQAQTLGKTAASLGIPAIIVRPYSPNLGSSGNPGWFEGGHLGEVKGIIDEVCQKYQCDTTNINVGGHSRGAIGAWMMVSTYGNFFHSVAPVSCCSSRGFKPQNFKGVKVWAMRGSGAGSGYSSDDTYGHCMNRDVNNIKKYAKAWHYTILPGTTHGGAGGNALTNKEMIKFIFTN